MPKNQQLRFDTAGPIAYLLVRSRRKTLSVEVNERAQVVARAPLRMPQAAIEAFIQAKAAWIQAHVSRRLAMPAPLEPTAAEAQALRRKAKDLLPNKVAYYAKLLGVTPQAITITSARTRFGSCSAKHRLCFSFRLMAYPMEAIDYVVVHELAHILHPNHSKAFYRTVARIFPDYPRRRALLRQAPAHPK